MTHISIEGMDGVGKTTVCRLLAKRLRYELRDSGVTASTTAQTSRR